jgi:hypothetical protein
LAIGQGDGVDAGSVGQGVRHAASWTGKCGDFRVLQVLVHHALHRWNNLFSDHEFCS